MRLTQPGGDESAANDRLHWQMQVLRSMVEHTDRTSSPDIALAGSELAADDLATAPFRASHTVHHALGVASDALRTTTLLMDAGDELRVPLIGLYPLLRTVIEGSALATWVLAPDERSIRVKRILETRLSDLHHDDQAVSVAYTTEPSDDARTRSEKAAALRENARWVKAEKRRLHTHAEQFGVELDAKGAPGFGPMLQAIAPVFGMEIGVVRGTWHLVSGLTHPSLSRAMSMSEVEVGARNEDGTFAATMSASLSTVNMAIDAAMVGYMTALAVVGNRGGRTDLAWTGNGILVPPRFERVWNDR